MKMNGYRSAVKNEPTPVTCVVLNETPKQADLVNIDSQKYSMANSEILSPKVSAIGERGRDFQIRGATPVSQKDSSINTGNASNSRRHHQLLSQDSQIIRSSISPMSHNRREGMMNSTQNQSDIKAQQMLNSFQQDSRAGLSMERRQSQISEDEKHVQTYFEFQQHKISNDAITASKEIMGEEMKGNNESSKRLLQPIDSQMQSSRNSDVGNTTSRFNTMTLSSVNEPIILSNQNSKYNIVMRQPSLEEQPLRNNEIPKKDGKENTYA